ncbi:hypothetical protein [Sphingobacterium sp. 1.A.5]|uniref:hypothetical protein n=1 Tax=Sphingobacterium sp. 1.A.5 TaxID=2044604 RepID=UPI000C0C10FF|nr:hypothetical protein [Sphingobacterium sp. 1.A.5]
MRILRQTSTRTWATIGLINLLIVALMGVIMRLKFILPMPFVQLKNLQHAHSHFAFTGWVSHLLMLLLVVITFRLGKNDPIPHNQNRILWANLMCSYGMLFSFIYQGYGVISILCSTCSILISYCFALTFWKDMREQQLDNRIARWFYMALVFLLISSVGTFYLAYIMGSHQLEVKRQLSAIYFYLHFQFNGWFFFAIMGLVSHLLSQLNILQRATDKLFYTLSIATIPLYLLSILWVKFHSVIYILITILVFVQ